MGEEGRGLLSSEANQSTEFLSPPPEHELLSPSPSKTRRDSLRTWKRCYGFEPQSVIICTVLFFAVVASMSWASYRWFAPRLLPRPSLETSLHKPNGTKIVGLVFYGRRQYFDILDCYLRRNLAINGGFLDEIHFLMHDTAKDDEDWLQSMIKTTPELDGKYMTFEYMTSSVKGLWEHCSEGNTIYVKFDDNLVYIHDDAIPRLVTSLTRHPEVYSIQANVVNSPTTRWYHLHAGAIQEYGPEAKPVRGVKSWRASMLPFYTGFVPEDGDYKTLPNGHRWLPLRNSNPVAMENTPAYKDAYIPSRLTKPNTTWASGAQELYSLLRNIEENELFLYHFAGRDGIWDLWYLPAPTNMLAIWGRNIQMKKFWETDLGGSEDPMSSRVPHELHRPAKIDTQAVVGLFSSIDHEEGMLKTDLLDRFRMYANEKVCAVDNQKKPFR